MQNNKQLIVTSKLTMETNMNEIDKIAKEELSKNKNEAEDFKIKTSVDTIVSFVLMSFCTYYYQFIDYHFF